MDTTASITPIAALRDLLGLTFKELGEKIGCSAGHACDLCTGRRAVTVHVARKLEELSGTPWHHWMEQKASSDPARQSPGEEEADLAPDFIDPPVLSADTPSEDAA